MSKLLRLGAVLALLLFVAACDTLETDQPAQDQTEAVASKGYSTSGGSNAHGFSPLASRNIGPLSVGDSERSRPDLKGDCGADTHTYDITFAEPGTLAINVRDLFITGDTIQATLTITKPNGQFWTRTRTATSPNSISFNNVITDPAFTAVLVVCYTSAPGGFPAGYEANIWYN
jgi:hypothetical protein